MGETIVTFSLSTFIITYVFLLYFATIIICGWFAVTRGWTEEQPDGTIRKYGKVFKGWYFFWFREVGKNKVYYNAYKLFELQDSIHQISKIPKENLKLDSSCGCGTQNVIISHADYELKIINAAKDLKIKTESIKHANGKEISFYKEEAGYYFPEWIRSMMAGCITCHATIYGNIIFWTFVAMVKYTFLSEQLFDFTTLPITYFVAVWFAYWISLAYTCTVAYKKMP